MRGPPAFGCDPREERGAGEQLERRVQHEGVGRFGARDADPVGHVGDERRIGPGRRAEVVVPAGGPFEEVGVQGRGHAGKVEVEVNFMSSTRIRPISRSVPCRTVTPTTSS